MKSSRKYNVAVIGATGSTGNSVLRIMAERKFPVENVYAIASKRSVGKLVSFGNQNLQVTNFSSVDFSKVDIAVLCAGSEFSRRNALAIAEVGCTVIDKTPCFRMDSKVPLVVPEVNANSLEKGAPLGIVSAPNCIAIPLSMIFKALSKISPIKRAVVSTYQAVSGAGKRAIDELYSQTKSLISAMETKSEVFSKQIAFNVIPSIGGMADSGISGEEDKVSLEIRKILRSDIKLAVTCVRVPVFIGHGISVACEFSKEMGDVEKARQALSEFGGILVVDNGEEDVFATPLDVQGEDSVYVSRIRQDCSVKNGLLFWVVADNLRRGAALNSVQIAEEMIAIDPQLRLFKNIVK